MFAISNKGVSFEVDAKDPQGCGEESVKVSNESKQQRNTRKTVFVHIYAMVVKRRFGRCIDVMAKDGIRGDLI